MNKVYTIAVEDDRGIKDTLNIEAPTEQEACKIAQEIAEIDLGMCEPIDIIASFEGIVIDITPDKDYRLLITRTDIGHFKIEEQKR